MTRRTQILIIHRDDSARREIHNILSRFNFDITYASDGLQGLETAKFNRPDLIICQIDVAILNGLEFGATIRKNPQLENVPLIMLHEELDLALINKAKLVDVRAFLIKPYIDNSLIYAIKRAIGEEQLEVNANQAPPSYDDCKSQVLSGYKYHYA